MTPVRENFVEYLRREFSDRCSKNHRYSLRGFARLIDMEVSSLSKILHGKRFPTRDTLDRIAGKLGLTPTEVDSRFGASLKKRETDRFVTLSLDVFKTIAEWQHMAILELTRVDDFKPDPQWIANRLGIDPELARNSIERLFRADLLKIDGKGRWIDTQAQATTIGHAKTTEAFRAFQKGILEKAISAMGRIPIEERDQSGMTMAANSKRIKGAKEKIKKFRRSLCSYLQKGGKKDAVYQISVSLYPLTKRN